MAAATYNPTFKRPANIPVQRLRSPSPPRAFVEPLSPSKPTPIEPSFNYPPLDNHVDFTVRPQSASAATTRAKDHSTSHKSAHHRTTSTIDTLAEAALAVSPSLPNHDRKSSVTFETNGYDRARPQQHSYGGSEPPHKRARSELLPSPQIAQYASRPATSYESHTGYAYDSRVEEAALLLNFQSGGWPATATATALPPPPGHAPRPHANSFPQDAFHMRPVEAVSPLKPTLLPPFNPQDAHQPPPTLPSPQQTVDDIDPSPKDQIISHDGDVEMADITSMQTHMHTEPRTIVMPQQTQTPPDETESRAVSADISMSEASDAPKARRGWPKGKPRGSGAKKTMAEKAATKRAASRKKAPGAKAARARADGVGSEWFDAQEVRRKSLSDVLVFDEIEHDTDLLRDALRARSVPCETPMLIRETSPSKAARRKVTVNSDTICAGCQTSRESANSHGELDEWISCNGCKKWFHVDCAGFRRAHEVRDVDKYFCTACEPEHGKTTYVRKSTRAHVSVDYAELQRGVLKTSEESPEHHYIQPIKDGTFQFDPEFFPRMRPEIVTKDFFEKSGTFVEPICVPAEWNPRPWVTSGEARGGADGDAQVEERCGNDAMADLLPEDFEYDAVPDYGQDRLEMVMPEGLTVRHVCNLVGATIPIDVIDVKTQNTGAKWTLSRWAEYYEDPGEGRAIRNVISLEVSQTKLGRLLQRPKIVRDIDLQDDVWPQEEIDRGKFPKVQFYCLMSVADSYTDFHIDFGGSSVYYHILKGKKTFFFIPPKPKHLKAYEEWNDSPQQNYTFLPSITKECYRVDLSEGDTMLIPSGWIHAVWTPEDSLVVGGNFLNRMSYKNQFRVVEIEKTNETPMKFRYPFFQKIMWYTAIKYLKTDPLPEAVCQLFYEGRRFEREVPLWGDFDGDIARNDPRPGADNARYYSQAEIEGLSELVNYIFRTVMLVMGRVEGISTDRMKRVSASIPKGYGEPLEVAKTFALWVAWKRGNEDPPAWAHPDAVLPNSKDEGPPKKLSERKLKELERREAIAAWRIAPDRQSARVMSKNAATAASATFDDTPVSSPAGAQSQMPSQTLPYYQNQPFALTQESPPPAPTAFVMSSLPGAHLSTPKTSVLGPKRVACDACRKRRIRCKHKEMVMQTTPNGDGQMDAFQSHQLTLAPELHDNITVTPPKQRDGANFFNTVMDGQQAVAPNVQASGGLVKGDGMANSEQGSGPFPGTNAYVNASIPMTMNGVAIFGETLKRGRSKACYECRKSKRRCIHDENGNVDAVKAAEAPVPRGSVASKKRPPTEDGSPVQVKKQKQADGGHAYPQPQQPSLMQGHGVLKPHPVPNSNGYQPRMSSANGEGREQQSLQPSEDHQEEQPPIDPHLFALYPEPEHNETYQDTRYPYPTTEQPQSYNNPPQSSYNIPSLEQIANEVLVDMNGNEYQEPGQQPILHEHVHAYGNADTAPMPNGHSKPDESVDSAVSLPTTETLEQTTIETALPNGNDLSDTTADVESSPATVIIHHELPPAHPSIETDGFQANNNDEPTSPMTDVKLSPTKVKRPASSLPLYQPPAPLPSTSPESTKRQPVIPNGIAHGASTSPTDTMASPHKRKRDSTSVTPAGSKHTAKKVKVNGERSGSRELAPGEDRVSMELAKMLQQEELGLRRRSK